VYPGEVLHPDAHGLPSGAELSWYLDGNPVDISEIIVPTGQSSISITALAETPPAAGSDTVSLEVSSISPVGGRVFAGSVGREALSSPREVAVLGDSLLVSDYEREKTWRVTIDASAATVDAESFTLIEDSFGVLEATSPSGGGGTGREPIDGSVVWFASTDEIRRFDGGVELAAAVPTSDGRALAVSANLAFLVGQTSVVRFELSDNDLRVAELAGSEELLAADIRAATLDSTGELYVVDFASDSVLRYAVEDDTLALIQLLSDGADGIAEMNGPHDVLWSGSDLYVCSYYDDAVTWFRLDPETGMLTFQAAYADVAQGATALAISRDERTLLVAAGTGDAVAVLNRDPETGELDPLGTIRRDGALDSPRSIALSDGPAFVASANSGAVDVIREYRGRTVE
jgi:predicted secreted protein